MILSLFISLSILFVPTRSDRLHSLYDIKSFSDSILVTGWYFISNEENAYRRQLVKDTISYYIDPRPLVTARNIISIKIYETKEGQYALSMKLDEIGTKIWYHATYQKVGLRIAFVVDNVLMYTPKVNEPIYNGIAPLNRGVFSKEELEKIMSIIKSEQH